MASFFHPRALQEHVHFDIIGVNVTLVYAQQHLHAKDKHGYLDSKGTFILLK